MRQDKPDSFMDRLERIKDAHDFSVSHGFVARPDGLIVPMSQPRLRFTFPLRGLLFAFCIALLVKSYLIWVLGHDVYSHAVIGLLNGSGIEQVAGKILMPDELSLWVVQGFDWIAARLG